MKICPVGALLFQAAGWTDMTKLTAAFRNFANAPKNGLLEYHVSIHEGATLIEGVRSWDFRVEI